MARSKSEVNNIKITFLGASDDVTTALLNKLSWTDLTRTTYRSLNIDGINLDLWKAFSDPNRSEINKECYIKGSKHIFIVFDLSNRDSFDAIPQYLKDCKSQNISPGNITIVAYKSDMQAPQRVAHQEFLNLAQKNNSKYAIVSAESDNSQTLIAKLFGPIMDQLTSTSSSTASPHTLLTMPRQSPSSNSQNHSHQQTGYSKRPKQPIKKERRNSDNEHAPSHESNLWYTKLPGNGSECVKQLYAEIKDLKEQMDKTSKQKRNSRTYHILYEKHTNLCYILEQLESATNSKYMTAIQTDKFKNTIKTTKSISYYNIIINALAAVLNYIVAGLNYLNPWQTSVRENNKKQRGNPHAFFTLTSEQQIEVAVNMVKEYRTGPQGV